jgi:hypothetical protein
VFIGYCYSFFVALLLSLFYLGYAASGLFEQIRKEVTGKPEALSYTVSAPSSQEIFHFVFHYVVDIPEQSRQSIFSEFVIALPVVIIDRILCRKICLSEYFLRPPPKRHPSR